MDAHHRTGEHLCLESIEVHYMEKIPGMFSSKTLISLRLKKEIHKHLDDMGVSKLTGFFFFFCYQHFLFFTQNTTQHPKYNKTKQQTHTQHFKVQSKGRERGKDTKNMEILIWKWTNPLSFSLFNLSWLVIDVCTSHVLVMDYVCLVE